MPNTSDNGDQIVRGYDKICKKNADVNPNYKNLTLFLLLFKEAKS